MKPSFQTRKKIRLSPSSYKEGHAFFVTIGTHQRYPWFRLYVQLCEDAVHIMKQMIITRKSEMYAWCFMPDHVHFLLKDKNLIDFVRLFKGRMTPKAMALESGQRLWQRSFYDHGLRREESVKDVALYIWKNPIRKGFVDDPLQYRWSGSETWPQWRSFFGRG
ncbi:MAG: transposase [Deltaproteobacteria bacterium]|nr:transposase [Deltaproteobacteria bacterium]